MSILKKYYKKFFVIFVGLIVNNLAYTTQPIETSDIDRAKVLEKQRSLFIKAEEALKRSRSLKEKQHILKHSHSFLFDYPLFPYLELTYLKQSIGSVDLNKMLNFVERYPHTQLAQNLRESWLLHNAKKSDWENFLAGYDPKDVNNTELECYFIQAHMKFKDNNLEDFAEQIKKIWLNNNAQPKACDVLFDNWRNRGLMTKSMVWQRIKLAISANNLKFAKYLAEHYLLTPEKTMVDLWIKVHKDPNLIRQKKYFTHTNHPVITEILMYGIAKIAKKSPEQAITIWHNWSKEHAFNNRHYNQIIKSIGISLAKHSDEQAWQWLHKISPEYRDQEVYNLILVIALKNAKWDHIIEIYEELPTVIKNQEKWRYWYARALETQKRTLDGKKILIELATNRSYYGFLSSAKLLKPYSFKFKPVTISSNQMESILQNKSLQRAYELLKLDRINKATKEWNTALKNMVEWELHAAAKLADSLNMPNWAILALSDAQDQDDLSLRFPQYYANQIVNAAKNNKLDPAWVFAVTRQESAFRPYVKSYAGALGLMQVMPKTGFMVAKAINMPLKNHKDLLDINNNVKLGSKYLQLMLDKYKNLVVATAAYNAGPGRIQKWLPNYEVDADIWVETIPFKDTKEYVQNVMTYTVIYQKLLGNNHYINMPLIKKI